MQNIQIVEIDTPTGVETHIIIDRGNGEFTSMPKAVYDAQQAEHLNGIVDGETL